MDDYRVPIRCENHPGVLADLGVVKKRSMVGEW